MLTPLTDTPPQVRPNADWAKKAPKKSQSQQSGLGDLGSVGSGLFAAAGSRRDRGSFTAPDKDVCFQFLQGRCTYGDRCRFQHPVDPRKVRRRAVGVAVALACPWPLLLLRRAEPPLLRSECLSPSCLRRSRPASSWRGRPTTPGRRCAWWPRRRAPYDAPPSPSSFCSCSTRGAPRAAGELRPPATSSSPEARPLPRPPAARRPSARSAAALGPSPPRRTRTTCCRRLIWRSGTQHTAPG